MDSTGQTIDFLLAAKRDTAAAKRFFEKVFSSSSNPIPRVINVDKNPAYPGVVEALKAEGTHPRRVLFASVQVSRQCHRTGSSNHQKAYLVGKGLRLLSKCLANSRGYRNDEHDPQGPRQMGGKERRCCGSDGSSLRSSLSQPNFSLTFTTECASAPWAANFAMKPVLFAPCQPALTRLKIHLLSLDFHQTRRRSLEKDRFCRFPENPFLVFRSQERQLAMNELERLCIGVGLLRLEGRVGPPH